MTCRDIAFMEGTAESAELPPLDPPAGEVEAAPVQDAPAPVAADPTPAPSQIDPREIARIVAAESARSFEKFAPKPEAPKQAWQDPSFYDLRGFEGDKALAEFHRRQTMHAEALAESKAAAAVEKLREEFRGALHGQSAYFNTLYNPEHGAYRAHLDKYIRKGYEEADAVRLAKQDAGVTNATGSAGPRSVPTPPKYATSPGSRSPSAPATAKALNQFDTKAVREAGRRRALELGYHPDEID